MTRVIIYGTPTCPWCKYAIRWFEDKNIKYEYIDVSVDDIALNLMKEKTGQMGVPVVNINGTYLVGFQPEKFDKLLTIR